MTGLLTAASMCSGYGGLDMAVAAVLDTRLLWVADNDDAAARVLAHRFPGVPNLGDLTGIDWGTVPAPDVLTAGFPCQDLSYAGHGAGIKEGTRSGLWHTIADAVATLRPRLLVLENVRAIVTRRPGLEVVLADLARLGFDANWTCLRASDLGAAHERKRWFCLAWPTTDTGRTRRQGGWLPGTTAERVRAAADASHFRHQRGGPAWRRRVGPTHRDLPPTDWGPYAPAIARWEATFGHPAPRPVEPGRGGKPRLSPRFSEWLMGLPPGWVTDVPGISRNGQLHLLGNGVLPLQAAAAVAALLPDHLRPYAITSSEVIAA
ncbi:DNA (cytosine-5-)-methyltransferase [Nonomuraea jabiensis]|uniref:DNA cytosine methyltransferase n=1 Tax=Nonomuraea jabiensis TaxID=882448 RepID=UPI00342A812E